MCKVKIAVALAALACMRTIDSLHRLGSRKRLVGCEYVTQSHCDVHCSCNAEKMAWGVYMYFAAPLDTTESDKLGLASIGILYQLSHGEIEGLNADLFNARSSRLITSSPTAIWN